MTVDPDSVRGLALTFFFAVYWSAMISSMRTFKAFQIWTIGRSTHGTRPFWRLLHGVIVLNFIPIAIFAFLYAEPWFKIVPHSAPAALLCAGVASLSVFSVVFLLPGLLQAGLGRKLYPDHATSPNESWEALARAEGDIEPTDSAKAMLITAILYVVVPVLLSASLAACMR